MYVSVRLCFWACGGIAFAWYACEAPGLTHRCSHVAHTGLELSVVKAAGIPDSSASASKCWDYRNAPAVPDSIISYV